MTTNERPDMQAVCTFIAGRDNFAVFTHLHPDGDALGSSFALTSLLRTLGKQAVTILLEEPPYKYDFPEFQGFYTVLKEADMQDYQAAVAVDCAALMRLGTARKPFSRLPSLSIDHHISNDEFAQVNYVTDAPATAQLIFELFAQYDIRPDTAAQTALYMGMITDTGNLTYSCTTPKAFEICYELACMGLNTSEVAERIYNTRSWAATELISVFISSIRMHCGGRLAIGHLSCEELRRIGASTSDTESLINYARDIDSVQLACFLREISEGKYKVSMRSKGTLDVAALTARYGGGGHRKAAGCVMEGTLDTVREEIIGAAEELFV